VEPVESGVQRRISGDLALARHPWEITLREFVEKVRHDYGVELSLSSVILATSLIVRKDDRLYPLPVVDADVPLPLDVLRTLCRTFNFPPLDFHLDPDDED
jgi:hypothetical protein